MSDRYISVLTNRPDEVSAFLYDHTSVLGRTDGPHQSTLLLRTVAPSEARAEFLVKYQADRLMSGLIGARVHETLADAQAWLGDAFPDVA